MDPVHILFSVASLADVKGKGTQSLVALWHRIKSRGGPQNDLCDRVSSYSMLTLTRVADEVLNGLKINTEARLIHQ